MIHSPNDLIMAKVFSQDKKKIGDELPYYRSILDPSVSLITGGWDQEHRVTPWTVALTAPDPFSS